MKNLLAVLITLSLLPFAASANTETSEHKEHHKKHHEGSEHHKEHHKDHKGSEHHQHEAAK